MSEGILAALITGGLSLVGVIISGLLTTKKTETAMKVAQAVTDTKLEELTREVRAHNNFAQRMPVVEEQIKAMNHRVGNLEQYHKQPLN
jgi:fructose-1-phosphate kinase PfkB-like protein